MAVTDPNLLIRTGVERSTVGGPATIEVVWSLRDHCWYMRGLSMPEWRRAHGHLPANQTDQSLLEVAGSMFGHGPVRGARVRRFEPVFRLPKGASAP